MNTHDEPYKNTRRLAAWMDKFDISPEEVARKSPFDARTIKRWYKGSNPPTAANDKRLAEFMDRMEYDYNMDKLSKQLTVEDITEAVCSGILKAVKVLAGGKHGI